jgi:hypothetical protein
MAFDGKATYDDSDSIHEDVSDVVTANSKVETPFLDFIGTGPAAARNTTHEWLEDDVLANTDALNEDLDNSETDVDVDDGTKFRVGDIIMVDDELMDVASIATNTLTVTARGYGSSDAATHDDNAVVTILGNAALEGADADAPVSTNRARKINYTQIFTPHTIKVSDTQRAVSLIGVADEYEHQKEQRILEAMRQLENSCINGSKASSTPAGSDTIKRSLEGFKWWCSSNVYSEASATLTEARLRAILQLSYANGMYAADFLMCNAFQKQLISGFKQAISNVEMGDRTHSVITDAYASDFGTLRIILNRWVPADELLIGTSKFVKVVPLQGRSFFHKPLAEAGAYTKGMIQGEYTLEVKHEGAHAWVKTLATS